MSTTFAYCRVSTLNQDCATQKDSITQRAPHALRKPVLPAERTPCVESYHGYDREWDQLIM